MNRNETWLSTLWNRTSLQGKLTVSFFSTIFIILLINVFMFTNINTVIGRVDEVYVSNVNLNELTEGLTAVENYMKEYLDTKSTDALNSYYLAEQEYRNQLSMLNTQVTNHKRLIMEKNIHEQSETYLEVVYETVQAKRGRNVEKYKANYEKAETIYHDIQNCIFSLNNEQFKYNSNSYKVLLSSLKYIEIVSTFILAIMGAVNLILVVTLTGRMTMPLRNLARAANKVAKGNFDVEIEPSETQDELGILSNAFQEMIASIQQYIQQIKDSMERESKLKENELLMESKVKEAQLKSLQAQINPHFLFNTLNAGAQLAMMEGADKTTEFIESVAAFFRLNMKSMDHETTIEEEIKMVDYYIYILNVRFTGEIHFEKEIDESLLNVEMPGMILQPIVENAVNYGIRNIDWEGEIKLKVYRRNDMAFLEISDNGAGMERDTIERIMAGTITSSSKNGNGIGLVNVLERLRLFTGHEHVCEVYSEGLGKGSSFVLKIPVYR